MNTQSISHVEPKTLVPCIGVYLRFLPEKKACSNGSHNPSKIISTRAEVEEDRNKTDLCQSDHLGRGI